ncbi:unnamed protein product [Ilex paraguariensis]|uniref:CASP-like protein n=1 Tax=Ilex paraguariensis TaxID=185542 RepID=A0ABC8U080_9AQUA
MESEMTKQVSSFTVQVLPAPEPVPKSLSPPPRGFFMAQIGLRILAIAFTLAAICIIVTSAQTVTIFGIDMRASYTYSSAFRFKVGADAVVCACSLLSLIVVCVMNRPKSNTQNYFYTLLHDMVMMVLAISGCAAATAIGYVGRYGQSQTGWIAICDRVGKFCDKVTLSVSLSYLAVFCLLMLTIMDAYKLKSLPTE